MKIVYDARRVQPVLNRAWAEKHSEFYGRWLAKYEGPNIGVRHVRDGCKRPVIYATPWEAEADAKDALINATNRNPPMRQQRVIVIDKSKRGARKWPVSLFKT